MNRAHAFSIAENAFALTVILRSRVLPALQEFVRSAATLEGVAAGITPEEFGKAIEEIGGDAEKGAPAVEALSRALALARVARHLRPAVEAFKES